MSKQSKAFNFLALLVMLSMIVTSVSAQPVPVVQEPAPVEVADEVETTIDVKAPVDISVDAPPEPEMVLTDPYVSDPVSPADTTGLSLAPQPSVHTGAPQENTARLFRPQDAVIKPAGPDAVLQNRPGRGDMPAPIQNWEGIDATGVLPPDTDGQIGSGHYVQIVNSSTGSAVRVWDKVGTQLYNFNMEDLWPTSDPCYIYANGDPVVLYDQLADRWVLTQFAVPSPYYECIAVSKGVTPTNDPNDWWLYTFYAHEDKMNDYPKLGVWPDGYYMAANQFPDDTTERYTTGAWVYERDKMLNGEPATFQYFDLEILDPTWDFFRVLPSNLMGDNLPPAGAPNYFGSVDWHYSGDDSVFHVFAFHTDWDTPANSTFSMVKDMVISDYTALCPGERSCVPQPDTAQGLDGLSPRLMMHLWYRNFDYYETLVVNHTVDVGGGRAGIRWYEIRDPGPDAYIYQEGTFAPDDGQYRWMGSIAMDKVGNIGLGYSIASETMYPSIRYTGRLAGDPLGELPEGEETIINGTGSQTHTAARWGDYSAMSVDPLDDCTFWYTTEYIETTGSAPWQTRIASFQFPNCMDATGALEGNVTDAGDSNPIGHAKVEAETNPTYVSYSQMDGDYGFAAVPTGTYTMTFSAYGYQTLQVINVDVVSGSTTTQDAALTPLASYVVSGTVTDASTGWPLYASIEIEGYPYGDIWNNPVTGFYSVSLSSGSLHTFTVSAWVNGYEDEVRAIPLLTGDTTEDFALNADMGTCAAPGYAPTEVVYSEDFEANDGGYTHAGAQDEWEWGAPTVEPFGCVSGVNCWGTDLDGNYNDDADYVLTSTLISLAAYPTGTILTANWWQAWSMELGFDYATAQINDGSGWTDLWSASTDGGWTMMSYDISSAAGGNVQFRWGLTSDGGVNEEGYYIDDVEITAGCEVIPGGGLVVGNVYDNNTMTPLLGAEVSNESGEMATTVAVPADLAVDDGFYTIFSMSGPTETFDAAMTYYQSEFAIVTVALSDTVRQDFYLEAGDLSYELDSYDVTLEMGDSTTEIFTLTNAGGAAVSFELVEIPEALPQPLHLSQPTRFNGRGDNTLNWATHAGRAVDVSKFASYKAPYQPTGDITLTHSLSQTIIGGNSVACRYDGTDYHTDNSYLRQFDLAAFGITQDFEVTNVEVGIETATAGAGGSQPVTINVYALDGALVWANMTLVGTTDTTVTDQALGIINVPVTGRVFAGLDLVVEFFMPDGQADTNVLMPGSNNLGQTDATYLAATGCGIAEPTATAVIGFPDMHMVMNVSGNEVAPITDFVPWLSEDPISGTLPATNYQTVDLTFDAGVPEITQPGEYHAELEIVHVTPYEVVNLPVTLTVTPPASAGELEGTVYGLGYCDVNTATLAGAVVEADDGSVISVTTESDGTYHVWLDAGNYTVTFVAADHASTIETVSIVTGTVYTQDAYLRSVGPCISVDPLSMEATLFSGDSDVQVLSVINSGAGDGSFEIGSAALLEEGFEDAVIPPPGGWLVSNTHSARNWTITNDPEYVHSGASAGWVNYDMPEASNEWLWTPILDLTSLANLNLEFWAVSDTDWCPGGGSGANMLIHATDTVGTPIATVWDMCNDENWAGPFEYRFASVDLSAYADQTIRLAWQYVGIDGQSFGLDDVTLSGMSVIPWLSENPISGTVSADSNFPVDVTFTALPTMTAGTYTDTMYVNTDDAVNDQFDVAVTLNIFDCVDVTGADFDFMPTDPEVDETVTFTATVDPGTATTPLTYTWNFGDGITPTLQTGNPIAHTFPITTTDQTYTVTMTVANACPSQQTVEKTVTVQVSAYEVYMPVVLR